MIFSNQQTIKKSVSCFGIGLHGGGKVTLKLVPAATDTGIVFRKIDNSGKIITDIPANYNAVSNTRLNTTITEINGKNSISTIEHLMAALWGCGIDNIIIEINSDEIPIMDGSSEHFVFMIESAGVIKQNKGRRIIEVLKRIDVREGDAIASISPDDNFSISLEIDFNHSVIPKQNSFFGSNHSSFKRDICRARTFGFEHEVEQLQKMGLAKGGSLDNAIVVGKDNILNKDGLRYNDEFVRHKVLDSIGDLYLAGANLKGHFRGYKSGHSLNNTLLRELFDDKNAWRVIQLPCESLINIQ